MIYISPNNEYPRHYGDIQLENKGWKLGDDLPDGWVQVAEAKLPTVGVDQVAYEEFPVEINKVLSQNWQVRNFTADELEQRDAPKIARQKLIDAGLTEAEIEALTKEIR
tara:strand:+ start:365 stop:691 length:327 start_codon:yes stop_codon:yes gene_type:complete